MHPVLQQYCTLVEFLGQALGSQYEIVLHDLSGESPCIAAIANNHISGRGPGAPLTDLALRFLADRVYEQQDWRANYRGASKGNSHLRCSTLFIKDETGKPIGMLCINYDTSVYFETVQRLAALFQIQPEAQPQQPAPADGNIENLSESIGDVVQGVLRSMLEDSNIPVQRLTQEEKLAIVDSLNQKGVFLLKGSVSEVAQQLACSEATIYRYLSKLNRGKA